MLITSFILSLLPLAAARAPSEHESQRRPILLDKSGGFTVGGKIINSPSFPNFTFPNFTLPKSTLSCDHGYMEYFIPWRPRQTSIVMWHSSSTQVWQNRWDGGEGFKDKFLRRRYPVYLWDGPRIGRANWACEPTRYTPFYQDQMNFVAWNFGPAYPDFWPGVQFPTDDKEAWQLATSARYVEYDTNKNVHLETEAAAVAADSGKLGDSIVYLANSASGLRAQMTVVKSNTTNIKAIVAYEGYGCVFPDTANITAGEPFGPMVVPLEDFKKLARLKAVQFVWGDHRSESYPLLRQTREAARLINLYGGNAQVFFLAKDGGLKGSTHSAFADMDNHKVAGLLEDFLEENGLDGYPDDEEEDGGDDGEDDGDEDGDEDWRKWERTS
ncbi:uncharacterized protein GGS25DRAFT_495492 [Hypoxylon fragiforme]|uniref:uncharacterized protein n=1 Tax=Hypoxylon fragiforme TaxID=63214 RepID=UPI0020C5CAEF|nr:uncharacterized protein GGS25DRAFT_495492 [Hypoxylon fragiforme]KAI2607359.1 hypothetical protein GGS25DRAFT_495492 [Hypoxylon fragiforme]